MVNFISMKYMHLLLLGALLILSGTPAKAQFSDEYKEIDDYVKSLGTMDTLNMGTIAFTITRKFADPKDKVRAIFDWVANNISFDLKAGRNNDNEKASTDIVLKTRKANAAGYAALFQDMCSWSRSGVSRWTAMQNTVRSRSMKNLISSIIHGP
jgi:hypothetical protein